MEALLHIMISPLIISALISMHLMTLPAFGRGDLDEGFYYKSCEELDYKVRSVLRPFIKQDKAALAGSLLRLQYHDCFVQGCDASILIDGPSSERNAGPNKGLAGFEVIDKIKEELEKPTGCPGVVSCADILALATMIAVNEADGPFWEVPLGRRDGKASSSEEVLSELPSPTDSVEEQIRKFVAKGLSRYDLVALVGAHTIGKTSCQAIMYRLYNFSENGNNPDPYNPTKPITTGNGADPSISAELLKSLRSICPLGSDGNTSVPLDNFSPEIFDSSFYKNLGSGNGVLESDQRLWAHRSTHNQVNMYGKDKKGQKWIGDFIYAMVKMSSIDVKTGTEGEIRNICSKVNN